MKRADNESNQANKKTLKSRKPLLQDLSSCSTMTPQGRVLEGAGTVAPRVCRCPFGCSRQIDGRYPHAVFCYTCGPRSKHLPEDPCRCAEAGAICCAADPDNDQDRSAPPLPPQGRFLEGCKAKEMCSTVGGSDEGVHSCSRPGSSPATGTGPSAAGLMEPGKVVWQVKEMRSTWRDFPRDLNAEVEQAFVDGRDGVQYVWPPLGGRYVTQYTINFHTMQQTNQASGFQRRVRRLALLAAGEATPAGLDE